MTGVFSKPCDELVKFAHMLDDAGIPWSNGSERDMLMWRVQSEDWHSDSESKWSVIYGAWSYGGIDGLLECHIPALGEPEGYLTAKGAFELVKRVAK